MKVITQIMHFDKDSLQEHGFFTERQQSAACCVAELLEEIKKSDGDDFGIAMFYITKADMLGDRPVTVWTGLAADAQRRLFEDYVLKRLKAKERKA